MSYLILNKEIIGIWPCDVKTSLSMDSILHSQKQKCMQVNELLKSSYFVGQ